MIQLQTLFPDSFNLTNVAKIAQVANANHIACDPINFLAPISLDYIVWVDS